MKKNSTDVYYHYHSKGDPAEDPYDFHVKPTNEWIDKNCGNFLGRWHYLKNETWGNFFKLTENKCSLMNDIWWDQREKNHKNDKEKLRLKIMDLEESNK